MEIRAIVEEKYSKLEKCSGHCEESCTSKFLNSDADPVMVGYSCHVAYLSRIIIYSESFGLNDSVDAITRLIGRYYDVKEEDVRIASRYPWDLGMEDQRELRRLITVSYWTQNYRRTKSEDKDRVAIFLCENCHTVFPQALSAQRILCADCTSERPDS